MVMFRTAILSFALSLASTQFASNSYAANLGRFSGHPVTDTRYMSALVRIKGANQRELGSKVTCSGIMISDRIILSAAHCPLSGNHNEVNVPYRFTETDPKATIPYGYHTSWTAYTAKRIDHPDFDFDEGSGPDLAIYYLEEPIPNWGIKVILDDGQIGANHLGKDVKVAGWGNDLLPGIDSYMVEESEPLLVGLDKFLASNTDQSVPLVPGYGAVLNQGVKPWRKRDSGGPVFFQHVDATVLLGIISRRIPSDRELTEQNDRQFGMFSLVSANLQWIRDNAGSCKIMLSAAK